MHTKRKNEKHIAFNTHLILYLVAIIIFLRLSICFAIEKEIDLSIFFAIVVLLLIFIFLTSPLYIVFSDKHVEIVYNFGQREEIKCGDIGNILLMGSWIQRGGGPPHYVIAYQRVEKRLFFVNGEIPKTRKTKKLLKKYYKKEIL